MLFRVWPTPSEELNKVLHNSINFIALDDSVFLPKTPIIQIATPEP